MTLAVIEITHEVLLFTMRVAFEEAVFSRIPPVASRWTLSTFWNSTLSYKIANHK